MMHYTKEDLRQRREAVRRWMARYGLIPMQLDILRDAVRWYWGGDIVDDLDDIVDVTLSSLRMMCTTYASKIERHQPKRAYRLRAIAASLYENRTFSKRKLAALYERGIGG